MLKKNIFAAAFVMACAFVSAQASAQAYFGSTVGRAKWNLDCSGTDSCTSSASGYKVFTGYEFTPMVSVEGAYVSLNETTARFGGLSASFTGRGLDLAAIFKTPSYKNFQGFGKVGIGELTASLAGQSAADNSYSTQGLIGFGALYPLNKDVSLRAEFDNRRVKVSGFNGSTSTVNMFSIGIQSVF
jgi:OOP family OmpA-OmpF porin